MSIAKETTSNISYKPIVEGKKVERPSSPLTKDFLASLAKTIHAHNAATAVTVQEIGDGIIVRQGHPTTEDEVSISSKESLKEVKEREAKELSEIVNQARDKLLFEGHIKTEFETLKEAIFHGRVSTDEDGYLHDLEKKSTELKKCGTTKDIQFPEFRKFAISKGKDKWGTKFPITWFYPSTGGFSEDFYCTPGHTNPWISNPKEVAIRFFRYVQDNYPTFNEQVSCFKVLNVKEGVVCNSWKLKGRQCPALTVEFTFKK